MGSSTALKPYVRVVLKHFRLILVGTVLAALTAVVIKGLVSSPKYEATAAILITQTHSRISFDPRFQTLEDSDLLARSTAAVQQAHRSSLVALVKSGAIAKDVAVRLGQELEEAPRDPAELLARVSASLGGTGTGQSASANVVEISATASDPHLAARIANLWAEAYVSHVNELYRRPGDSYDSVQRQLLTSEQTYRETEEALQAFLIESPLDLLRLRIDDTEGLIERQMEDRRWTLSRLYATRRRMQGLLEDVTSLHGQVQSSGVDGAATSSLSILMLKAQVFAGSEELPIELQLQAETMGNAVQSDAQEADLQALKGIVETRILALDVMIEEALSASLPDAVDGSQDELRQLRSDIEQESALKRELTSARDLAWETYSTLQTKAAELGIATEMEDVEVVLASSAVEPQRPMGKGILFTATVAAVLGFAICLLIVFGFYYLVDGGGHLEAKPA